MKNRNRIKLSEKRLHQIVNESIKNVLNEGQSDGNLIEKWNYWCANYYDDFIERAWADDPNMIEHLQSKFDRYYDMVGSYGVMNAFYLDLDYNNRRILEKFVLNNF